MHSRKQDEVLLEKVNNPLIQIAQLLFQIEPKPEVETKQEKPKEKNQPNALKNGERLYYQAKMREIKKSPTPQPPQQFKPSKKSESLLKNKTNLSLVQKTHLFMMRKQERLMMLKLKEEEIAQNKRMEDEQQLKVAQARHNSTKKINKAQFLQKMQDYNVERAINVHQLQLKHLKDKVNNNTYKPAISPSSQALVSGKKYSQMNFVQRQKYYEDRSKIHKAKLERDISMKIMPFRPNVEPIKRSPSRSVSHSAKKSPRKTPPTTTPKKKKVEVHYEPPTRPQTNMHNVTFTTFETPEPSHPPNPPNFQRSEHVDHSDWIRSVIYRNKKDVLYFMKSLLQHDETHTTKNIDILSP